MAKTGRRIMAVCCLAAIIGISWDTGLAAEKGTAGQQSAPKDDRAAAGSKAGSSMTKQLVKPGETRGFIPQPEPPGNQSSNKVVKPGETKGFIPQPEPPGKQSSGKAVKPGETKGFIPQPEPPGKQSSGKVVKPGETQGFIPQPEPPGKQVNKQMNSGVAQ